LTVVYFSTVDQRNLIYTQQNHEINFKNNLATENQTSIM